MVINTTLKKFIVCMKKIIIGKGKFYTYILKWDAMVYVGSKTAKNSNHEKLLVDGGYFTSSKYVKKYVKEVGKPYAIKVILFEKAEDAYAYETRYLKRVDARNNPKFLNLHNNEGTNILLSRDMLMARKKGLFPATNGIETVQMFNTDPRYLSGEYWHVTKGSVMVNDGLYNFRVKTNDPRYLSGELKSYMDGKNKGSENNFYGKHHTDEAKRKIVENRKSKNGGFYNKKYMDDNGNIVDCMITNNPMSNPNVLEKIRSFDYWKNKYFINKYENYAEIELFLLNNLDKINRQEFANKFNLTYTQSIGIIKKYKENKDRNMTNSESENL